MTRPRPARWAPRLYRPGDEAQILALLGRVFGTERSLDFWTWKFARNPLGHQIVVGVTPDDAVIAHLAGLPLRVQAEGRPLVFTCLVDLMADAEYRRSLRKASMYQALLVAWVKAFAVEDRIAVLYGILIRSSDRLGQAVVNATNAYNMTRVVRPLDGAGSPPSRRLARWRYEVRPVKRFEAWMDGFWERWTSDFRLATVRDAQFMNWRFALCPHVAYHSYALWDRWRSRAAGVAVLRLEWEGQPVATLADWIVPRGDLSASQALLAAMEGAARIGGSREICAWLPPASPEQQFFLARGYREEKTESPLAVKVFTPSLSVDWVVRHWYFTMADSDNV